MSEVLQEVIDIKTNVQDSLNQIDKLNKGLEGVNKQLVDIIKHFDALNNKSLGKINKQINNTVQNRNIANQNIAANYDFGTARKAVKGSTGAVMISDTGREQAFVDYQQAVIEETKEIKKDIAERRKLRQQKANTEQQKVENEKERNAKREDQSTREYANRQNKLAEARLLNARNNQAGALLNNPRYQIGRGMIEVGNIVSSMGTGGKLLSYALDTAGSIVKAPWAGAAAAVKNLVRAVKDLGGAAIQAYSEIESIKTQLGVVFSNQTQADDMFSQISQYAVRSPFGVQQTSELAVLLKQSGVYASDLMDTLKMLGDTAGGNMEKMKRIANNYAQIVSIGKASMLDMRQFAYAGIPIFEAVSKELNVSQQQLRKLISDGKVTSDIIEKVFKNLTGINGIFENATEKGAKTLKARLQNLQDAKQLAMSSVGEFGVKYGSKTGGDSYANRLVTWVEDIWQWLRENVNTKNLEKDVNTIASRDNEIDLLKNLIEYNKKQGKDTSNLEKMLEKRLMAIDVDKDRQTYASLYDQYTKGGPYKDTDFFKTQEELLQEATELIAQQGANNKEYWMQRTQEMYGTGWERYKNMLFTAMGPSNILSQEGAALLGVKARKGSEQALSNEEIDMRLEAILDVLKALENDAKIFDKLLEANRERNLLNAQQLSFDTVNKYSDSSGSLMTSFQELAELYRSSDEYKKKEEEERQKRLQSALDVLKKIEKNTDEAGRVDITKFTAAELQNYIKQGAFTSTEELDVVPGKGYSAEGRALLEKQYGYIQKLTKEFLSSLGANYYKEYNEINSNLVSSLSQYQDEKFYDQFKNLYDKNIKTIEAAIRIAGKDIGVASQLEGLKDLLAFATNRQETNTQGSKAVVDILSGKAGDQFIPLWKRILAQATGLSAEGIKSSAQTLDNYRNDMAVRSMASGVMSAVMKNSDISSAMALIKASNQVAQLKGTSSEVVQVDWKKTREAVKDFALQLSASTDVINAYKTALENELDTFRSLVAAGYTTPESQDLKNQKYVNAKKYSRLMESSGSQLVNAFGENLVTREGKEVWLGNNGKFYDSAEAKIAQDAAHEVEVDELVLTENMFNIIKSTLPQIQRDLHEATVRSLQNKALEDMLKEIKASQLFKMGANYRTQAGAETSSFLLNNPDYFTEAFDSSLKVIRDYYKDKNGDYLETYRWLEGISDADLTRMAINGEGGEYAESIAYIITEALKKTLREAEEFVTGGTYRNEKEKVNRKEIDEAVNETINRARMMNSQGYVAGDKLTPDRYSGARGLDNWLLKALGIDQKYDRTDLVSQAVRNGAAQNWGVSTWKNGETIDQKTLDTLSDDQIVENLSIADRLLIAMKAEAEGIRDIFEDMGASMLSAVKELAKGAFLAPFETLGEYLIKEDDYAENLKATMKGIAADLVSSLGSYATKAGLSLMAMGAEEHNWGLIAAGAALAATGGFATGLGNAMKDTSDASKEKDDKIRKLENLKSDLTKLLEQARTDALYYENNLRHKTALGMNEQFSYKSVHDAVITPRGDVVTTDPKDYLIATKTPQNLMGGGNVTVQPVINCNVVNNSNAKVRQEQQQNADGSIDIVTIIEEAAGNYIASSRSDAAFDTREYRLKGKQAIM